MPLALSLKPTTKQTVTEITKALGITMRSAYDWCFSDKNTGPHLLNIWHEDIIEEHGIIYFIDDSSEWAEKNRATAMQVQLNRASAVTSLIATAYYTKQAVHVAILDGVRTTTLRETSKAHQRELDEVVWYPHHRGSDGRIHVIRGVPQPSNFNPNSDRLIPASGKFIPIPPPPDKVEVKGTATFDRDSEVIKSAKRRAADGRCELCKREGFRTPNGGFYLEGHHVIPLNCGGVDDVRNVVAICADDHRRAHYGEDRHEIREDMIWNILYEHYPDEEEFFDMMDEKSRQITRGDLGDRRLEDNRVDS